MRPRPAVIGSAGVDVAAAGMVAAGQSVTGRAAAR